MLKKRTSFAEKSVIAYMEKGETYAQAKKRLDDLWARGEHPEQLRQERRYGNSRG